MENQHTSLVKQAPSNMQQSLFTVEQFSKTQPAFTQSSLRNIIYMANPRKSTQGVIQGNGLLECGAIIRVGRKVLIDGEKFIGWVKGRGVQDAQSRILET